MNIRNALIKAKKTGGIAVLGEEELIPWTGRMSTRTGGGTYNALDRYFQGRRISGNFFVGIGYDSLISDKWEVKNRDS